MNTEGLLNDLLYNKSNKELYSIICKEFIRKQLSERRLQTICNEGMIPGVVKFGRAWAIPMDAEKPIDKRGFL